MIEGRHVAHSINMNSLMQSNEIATLITDKTSDAFVCVDLDNRVTYWNRGAEQMLGWRKEDILGKPLDVIIPARHRADHNHGMARMRAGEPSKLAGQIIEVQAIHQSGKELPTELSLGALPGAVDGELSGFVAIIRDVTKRKVLEGERDTAITLLSEQMAAIEASEDGIAIADAAGVFTFMNQSHASMFGYPDKHALIGLPWWTLYGDHEAARLERDAMGSAAIGSSWRGQATGQCRDGTPIVQELTLSRLESGAILCVTRDIGQRLAAEREMARLREQLLVAERLHVMGQTASGLAHDFNNLILAISASAALLDAGSDKGAQRHITRIRNAADAATKLATKLLQPHKRRSELKEVNFGATIKKAVELVRLSLPSRGALTLDLPPTAVNGQADSTELAQVVLNLVHNARDAISGRDDGRVEVVLRKGAPGDASVPLRQGRMPDGEWALIRVKDNGPGMSDDELSRAFDPFYTSKGEKGSGLGLPLVSNIVIEAGGGIAVTSDFGNTQFDVYWPLAPEKAEDKTKLDEKNEKYPEISGLKILLVDDEQEALSSIENILEKFGAEVGSCSYAEDAISAIKEDLSAWSLLVTDYDMPDMNGAQIAAAVRAINPRLPIVLCSTMSKKIRNNHAIASLFDVIVDKNFSHKNLLFAVTKAISHHDTGE